MRGAAFFMWMLGSLGVGVYLESTSAAFATWCLGIAYAWYWFDK